MQCGCEGARDEKRSVPAGSTSHMTMQAFFLQHSRRDVRKGIPTKKNKEKPIQINNLKWPSK